jgi:hypothetical protein
MDVAPAVERYDLVFLSSDLEILHEMMTMEERPDVDLKAVLELCSPEPSPDPTICFSMDLGCYTVDVASCMNVFCVSILEKVTTSQSRMNCLNCLCPLLVLSTRAQEERSPNFNCSIIPLLDNPLFSLSSVIAFLVDGNPIESLSFVSTSTEVFCTFGDYPGTISQYSAGWEAAFEMVEVLGDNLYVMEGDINYVAAFNFLPTIKIIIFFQAGAGSEEFLSEFAGKVSVIPKVFSDIYFLPAE